MCGYNATRPRFGDLAWGRDPVHGQRRPLSSSCMSWAGILLHDQNVGNTHNITFIALSGRRLPGYQWKTGSFGNSYEPGTKSKKKYITVSEPIPSLGDVPLRRHPPRHMIGLPLVTVTSMSAVLRLRRPHPADLGCVAPKGCCH